MFLEIKTDDPLIINAIMKGFAGEFYVDPKEPNTYEALSDETKADIEEARAEYKASKKSKPGRKPLFNKGKIKALKAQLKNGVTFRELAEANHCSQMTIHRYVKGYVRA